MKNNDIKFMLKSMADKQEINDLQKSILNRVDTSKVLNNEPEIAPKPKRKIKLFPLLFSGLVLSVLLITLSITIGVNNSNQGVTDNPRGGDIPSNPVDPIRPTLSIMDVLDADMKVLYDNIVSQEALDIVNVAHTFNSISFDDVEASETKYLTPELELSIANDVNTYIYNIEDMLALVEKTKATTYENKDKKYDYSLVNKVTGAYGSYEMYYNEELTELKNSLENYRLKADLNGVIIYGDEKYNFTGLKRIKNNRLEYFTKIEIDSEKYVEVTEKFMSDSNEFEYKYHYGEKEKNVRIHQKLDENKNTKEISFVANEYKTNEVKLTITPTANKYILCKIKSRESEELDISKENNNYKFKFKNSGNVYTK